MWALIKGYLWVWGTFFALAVLLKYPAILIGWLVLFGIWVVILCWRAIQHKKALEQRARLLANEQAELDNVKYVIIK